jgi:peptidoglycan-associated lipoprotein
VNFDYDSAALTPAAKAILDQDAAIVQRNSGVRIEVQGHCDERGTTEYNLALGQRRADVVVRYLTGKGIASSRIKSVSYGEERPLSGGADEGSWSQNRRAELVVKEAGGATVNGSAN